MDYENQSPMAWLSFILLIVLYLRLYLCCSCINKTNWEGEKCNSYLKVVAT